MGREGREEFELLPGEKVKRGGEGQKTLSLRRGCGRRKGTNGLSSVTPITEKKGGRTKGLRAHP